MFAIRNTTMRLASTTGRRFATTAGIKKPFVPKNLERNFRENFMSDPSTYPLIVIMTTAVCFVVGMSANAFVSS